MLPKCWRMFWVEPIGLWILRAHRKEPHRIAEALGDDSSPSFELRARPFELVVSMPKGPYGKGLQANVVFGVRCRQHHPPGAGERVEIQRSLSSEIEAVAVLRGLHVCFVGPAGLEPATNGS